MNALHTPFGGLLIEKITGIRPEAWLCVGAGFAREDVKSLILFQGKGFIADAVVNLNELCLRMSGIAAERVLSSQARQEVLRTLLAEPKILSKMPEIKKLKRQRNFLQRLDHAIQAGRLAFAHKEEAMVYEERLFQALGQPFLLTSASSELSGQTTSAIRFEIRALAEAYEAWLGATHWYDLPLLLRKAIQNLKEGWPERWSRPQEIFHLTVQTPESLETEFWDTLAHHVKVERLDSLGAITQSPGEGDFSQKVSWHRWHTLDDAAEHLADQIVATATRGGSVCWESISGTQLAVLIPDHPSVRRTLKRVFQARRISLAEPRDPTQLRWDEDLKWALLPLEVVASQFERSKVISWLRNPHLEFRPEYPDWVAEINQRGIQNHLRSYSGGVLTQVHRYLSELNEEIGGKKTVQEFSDIHLKILKKSEYVSEQRLWLISFFEEHWQALACDIERVGLGEKKAPILFWLEKLGSRIRESSPPVEKLKPTHGVSLYRLQQAPVSQIHRLWILGLPPDGLTGEGIGDYWFNEREREVLSTEFAVRSNSQVTEERLRILRVWLSLAGTTVFLDASYDEGGRERESILPILNQLQVILRKNLPEQPEEKGCHPRFTKSYDAQRPIQPQEIDLGVSQYHQSMEPPVITATEIDRSSRCSFQALSYHRWRLRDVREPEPELWPDVKGNILHEAVRLLLVSLKEFPPGHFEFGISTQEALESAWKKQKALGLLRNARIEAYIQSRLLKVLNIFCEKEKAYLERSGSRPKGLDHLELKLHYPKFSLGGQPDRIDEHPEGLFIIDYKTSGTLAHGQDMVELGYRLQLPFYALALKKESNRPILGVQFIELDKKGGRKNGIFFNKYNGKAKGCLTPSPF
jgi:hypothetical protein